MVWLLIEWHWAIILGIIAFLLLTGWLVVDTDWF